MRLSLEGSQVTNTKLAETNKNVSNANTWGQCYKTFYGRELPISVKRYSVRGLQAFLGWDSIGR
jgi:hypothetical protein